MTALYQKCEVCNHKLSLGMKCGWTMGRFWVSNFTKYIFDITEGKETLFFLQYTLMSNSMQLWRFMSGISWDTRLWS